MGSPLVPSPSLPSNSFLSLPPRPHSLHLLLIQTLLSAINSRLTPVQAIRAPRPSPYCVRPLLLQLSILLPSPPPSITAPSSPPPPSPTSHPNPHPKFLPSISTRAGRPSQGGVTQAPGSLAGVQPEALGGGGRGSSSGRGLGVFFITLAGCSGSECLPAPPPPATPPRASSLPSCALGGETVRPRWTRGPGHTGTDDRGPSWAAQPPECSYYE